MKASDYIVSFLEKREIDTIFGYIGGMITHLVDSIDKNPNVKFVQTYHEQTAAIAAEGYAIESGNFGVAISTSGPGATNMITGIADAYFDSRPVLYITGQVNSYEYKYDKPIRQQGFQETDIVTMVKPITKYSKLIDNPEDLKYELEKALYIALSGRKGPVLLDLPMNIQRADIDPSQMHSFESNAEIKDDFDISKIISLLESSEKPMLLLGGGCINIETQKEIKSFLDKSQIPVVTSLMGRGIIDESYEHYIGMIGSYGNRCANMGIANSDLLIVLGSRLDTRQTGAMIDSFLEHGKIIHVDIDNDELEHHRIKQQIKINCSVYYFLKNLNERTINFSSYNKWNNYLSKLKTKYNQQKEIERFVENKLPYECMLYLNSIMKTNDIVCADIGQNQMWAAQALELKLGQKFITSGGLAPMGFSMPTAIGCAFANKNKTIYAINGDGGFHIAVQSIPLISQYDLPIKVVVLNNNALGMITQFQHLYFDDHMAGTTPSGGYYAPNIELLAKAYGLEYFKLCEQDLKNSSLKQNIINTKNCIVEFVIKGMTSVSPKLEYNKPISQPTPQLSNEEYHTSMNIQ
jgi:acetolactate synthase-1/2/3 large subunit